MHAARSHDPSLVIDFPLALARIGLWGLLLCKLMTADAIAGQVTLRWDYSASGAAGFFLYCGPSSHKYSTRIDVGNTETYSISTLPEGVPSFCAVTAYDPGKAESGYSNEISVLVPYAKPSVNFSATPSSGSAPLSVAFTNTTAGQVTSWTWAFGDGTTSTAQAPVHTYSASGNYTVVLTATGPGGTGTKSVAAAVVVGAIGAPVPPGLVAAYGFNEGTGGTVLDASGRNNNGALASGNLWTGQGKFGGALTFNGTSDKITIPDSTSLRLTTAMTLEAWVNPSKVDNAWRDVIYKGNDNYYLAATSSNGGRPAGRAGLNKIYGAAALPTNSWTHLATTYDGATLRFYVNATQVSSLSVTGAITTSTSPLQVGGDAIYGQYFQGMIDEVRIYDRALSQAEIQSDMNTPVAAAAPDTSPPTTPAGLSATAVGSTQINLSWPASSDNIGVSGYRLERCQGVGCTTFVQIATPSTITFSNTGLAANTAYRFRVRAVDAAGNLSGYSAITAVSTPPLDLTAPSTPAGLSAAVVGATQINLGWSASTDNVGVTAYRIERCAGANCTAFVELAIVAGTAFSNSGLTAGTPYSYRVRAADAAGNLSGYSNVATAITSAPDTVAPTAPTKLATTIVNGVQVALTWVNSTDNVGVASYRVERCQGASCTSFAQVATALGTAYTDVGLASKTSYSYRVRAADAAGNLSPYSAVATAVTLGAPTAAGLVAAYAFNEGSGSSANDASGNQNTGAITGANWTAQGRFGAALSFNGTSSLVQIASSASLNLASAMTLEAWVLPSAAQSGWRTIIQREVDAFFLHASNAKGTLVPAGGATFNGTVAYVTGATANPLNVWTHLALTYDGATLRLYVNGVQATAQSRTGAIQTNANPVRIGGNVPYGEYFLGTIDEVRIYNRALTAAEVQIDMKTPLIP